MREVSASADARVCRRWFWTWLVGRTAVWTTVAVALTPNAPLDLVEWLSWSREWSWGYPKHPPLSAWLAAAAVRLSPGDVWGVYVLSYLLVAASLWAAWRLAAEFLSPRLALAAVACLDGLLYLTRDPVEFNNNITLDLAWILSVWFFVRAVRSGELRWWTALGLAMGLGLLCKYTLAILIGAMAAYLIYDREARHHWRRPGPYVAAVVAFAIFAPHLVWMAEHGFVTIDYAVARTQSLRWATHLTNPAAFVIGQFVRAAPMLLILWPLLKRGRTPAGDRSAVLDWVVLGPPAVLLTISLVSGREIRDIWGSPLWTAAGVWLLVRAGRETTAGLRRAATAWAVTAGVVLTTCAVAGVACPYVIHKPLRAQYAGRTLADEVTRRWHAECAAPLAIAAGEPWRAGNVCCYSQDRPVLYSSGVTGEFVFEPHLTPWTGDEDLIARGGVLLWDAAQLGDALPAETRRRFPTADVQTPIVLPYQTGAAVAPDRVGVAFMWPATHGHRAVAARHDAAPVRR